MATDTSTTNVIERHATGGLAGLLIVVGALLLLVPEPITPVVGAVLVPAGIGSWITVGS